MNQKSLRKLSYILICALKSHIQFPIYIQIHVFMNSQIKSLVNVYRVVIHKICMYQDYVIYKNVNV